MLNEVLDYQVPAVKQITMSLCASVIIAVSIFWGDVYWLKSLGSFAYRSRRDNL